MDSRPHRRHKPPFSNTSSVVWIGWEAGLLLPFKQDQVNRYERYERHAILNNFSTDQIAIELT